MTAPIIASVILLQYYIKVIPMSRVTKKGQVTIPKEVREELGIRPGDEIEFIETKRGYQIKKEREDNPFEKWRGTADTEKSVSERMTELRGER